jgi:hypothetical protein
MLDELCKNVGCIIFPCWRLRHDFTILLQTNGDLLNTIYFFYMSRLKMLHKSFATCLKFLRILIKCCKSMSHFFVISSR